MACRPSLASATIKILLYAANCHLFVFVTIELLGTSWDFTQETVTSDEVYALQVCLAYACPKADWMKS
jgi:hypothetical protein